MPADFSALTDRIDQVLPQTQCTQCGYDGCLPYARAIATEHVAINRCPPGGLAGLALLREVTGQTATELDVTRGTTKPLLLAVIDEARCIGCTLCIAACPVDAILGAAKQMHIVVADNCSGCELCIAPCPVDCISMQAAHVEWDQVRADAARTRHRNRANRAARIASLTAAKRAIRLSTRADEHGHTAPVDQAAQNRKRALLAEVQARARARRSGITPSGSNDG